MKLQPNILTIPKNNQESRPNRSNTKNEFPDFVKPFPTFSRILLWMALGIYVFFTFTLTALIAGLASRNYNTLLLISQRVSELSSLTPVLPVCPDKQLTTIPMHSTTKTTFTPSILPQTSPELDEETSTTPTSDKIPAYKFFNNLNRTEPELIDYDFRCNITCTHPNKTIVNVKLELQLATTNYTVEAFILGEGNRQMDNEKGKNYVSFLTIAALFPDKLSKVVDNRLTWHEPLIPCFNATADSRRC